MNLYPYNLYILLIAFVILIIYLCLTLKKVNPLLSKVNHILIDTLPIKCYYLLISYPKYYQIKISYLFLLSWLLVSRHMDITHIYFFRR